MNKVDFLIIGGSAAGTTAAEVIRGLKPDASITIVTDEPHEQYSRVLLPHYIRHKVEREQVFLKKPEWYQGKLIELIKGIKVIKLNPIGHQVSLGNGEEIQYGKLLISIGGYVIKLDVPGADLGNILYMRTIEDADEIIKAAKVSKRGVIVGGGFIGLEFCSGFVKNGVSDVTVLVMEPYFWQGKLDEDSSKVLVGTLEKNGVKVLVNEEVDHFEPIQGTTLNEGGTFQRRIAKVVTKSGKTFDADVVGVGIGIKPDLSWLEGSGIKINQGIVTNEYLETNLPDVYAAGDCAEFKDVLFDRQHIMGNWANATSQGSAVGKTMAHSTLRSNSGQASSGQAGEKTVFETASSYSINFFETGSCTFIGVTDDKFADEVITRGSVESGKMTRIFLKKFSGHTSEVSQAASLHTSEVSVESEQIRVVGATIINNPGEVAPLTSAVKNKSDISANKDKLGDANFDLKEIMVS